MAPSTQHFFDVQLSTANIIPTIRRDVANERNGRGGLSSTYLPPLWVRYVRTIWYPAPTNNTTERSTRPVVT